MEPARPTAQDSLQLMLWSLPDPSKTHQVALYDLAPRFVFGRRDEALTAGRPHTVERDFTFAGKRHRITLKPTLVTLPDGTEVLRHLGEREQLVEEVIRRLACGAGRLSVTDHGPPPAAPRRGRPAPDPAGGSGCQVRFHFRVAEVEAELAARGHTLSGEEVREAIVLLGEVRMRIECLDDRLVHLHTSAFPNVSIRRRGNPGADVFVDFNPLVVSSIKALDFQQVDYALLMSSRDPAVRWLLRALHAHFAATREPVLRMGALHMRGQSGMPLWTKGREVLRRMGQAVDVLVRQDVLASAERSYAKAGRRKADLTFAMALSDSFMAGVLRACLLEDANRRELAAFGGDGRAGVDFHPIGSLDAAAIRARRPPARALPAPHPPLL